MTTKPEIYIWVNKSGECPVTFLPEFIYHRSTESSGSVVYTYNDKPIYEKRKEIINSFNDAVTDYFTVHTRTINVDIPIHEHTNIILVPCIDFVMLLHCITSIPQYLYNFCEQHNIRICLNYIRECITELQREKINEYIEKFYIKKGYNKKYIKILINAFEIVNDCCLVHTNVFDKFLFKKIKNKHYTFLQKRQYKFSVLYGLLYERPHRINFLYECKKNNLINNFYFYSIICMNYDSTHRYVQNYLTPERYSIIKDLIYHKVYNNEGILLKKQEHIYNDGHEYDIPIQVLDSYINIVLETNTDTPSITEKIYKPILCGIPFIWLGYKNISNHLINQGYKLYPFINYEFDKGETESERIKLLIKEMLRLSNIDLEYWVNETKDIALHNTNNFLTQQYTANDLYNQLKYE
jgi:hypothetical protein